MGEPRSRPWPRPRRSWAHVVVVDAGMAGILTAIEVEVEERR